VQLNAEVRKSECRSKTGYYFCILTSYFCILTSYFCILTSDFTLTHLSPDNLCGTAGFNNSGVDRLGVGHLGLTIWVGPEWNRSAVSAHPPEKLRVSNFDDNQDRPNTLPSPELNPLTNPVLGRNMGRWAEVYFTSPPEKREQAVQELLRELERDSSAGETSAQATAGPGDPGNVVEEGRTFFSENFPANFSADSGEDFSAASAEMDSEASAEASRNYSETSPGLAAPLREEFIQCQSCGQLALVEQKFCGACGSALPVRGSVPVTRPGNGAGAQVSATPEPGLELATQADRLGNEKFEFERFEEEGKIHEETFAGQNGDRNSDQKIDQFHTPVEAVLHDRQLIWAQGVKPITDDVPRLFLDQQRARQRRSRGLMGAALAILVATLFYVGARGTTAWLRAHDVERNAAAKVDPADGRSSSGESPLPAHTTKRDDVTPAVVVHASSPAAAGYSAARPNDKPNENDKKNPAENNGSGTAASSQKSMVPTNAADVRLNPLDDRALADHALTDRGGHGAEELAIAESFLSATQGKARDSNEAAQWLWKAVGKQNAVAALLLSDLYVTGDGVPRNCDQARLLLDAAARKGVPGAGERIRDLPNMGCE
jgi:hypothetical protein